MELTQRYLQAVFGATGQPQVEITGLTPSLLSTAAVSVLPVTAAGITITQSQLRLPLGFSNEMAAVAERVQTTLGDGPCLAAAAEATVLVVDADRIAERWPAYEAELHEQTPFRSVAAIPLRIRDEPAFGALNLYSTRPDLSRHLKVEDATAVGIAMATLLSGLLGHLYDEGDVELPGWLDNPRAVDRVEVWTVVGMVMEAGRLDDADALALLRAYAYGHGLTLDELAARVLDRRMSTADLL